MHSSAKTHYNSSSTTPILGNHKRHHQRTALGLCHMCPIHMAPHVTVPALHHHLSIFIGGKKKVSNLLFYAPNPQYLTRGGHAYTYTLTFIRRYAKSPMGFPGGPLSRRSASPSVRCTRLNVGFFVS